MLEAIEVLLNIVLAVALVFAVVTWIWRLKAIIKSDNSHNSLSASFWVDIVLVVIEACLFLIHYFMGQGYEVNLLLTILWLMNAVLVLHDT